LIVLGVLLILAGIRLYDSGIYRFMSGNDLTVFCDRGHGHTPCLFLPNGQTRYRIDADIDFDVDGLLSGSMARVIKEYQMEGGLMIYAFSPLIAQHVVLHGRRVNMMIFLGERAINVGVPMLLGSF